MSGVSRAATRPWPRRSFPPRARPLAREAAPMTSARERAVARPSSTRYPTSSSRRHTSAGAHDCRSRHFPVRLFVPLRLRTGLYSPHCRRRPRRRRRSYAACRDRPRPSSRTPGRPPARPRGSHRAPDHQLSPAYGLDDLGHNERRDLLGCPCADVYTHRCVDP